MMRVGKVGAQSMNDDLRARFQALGERIGDAVVGQQQVVQSLLIALLCNGNLLLEGFPGTAKTRAVKTLARALSASFGRVQFTPDLLPSDVTGTEVYDELDGRPQLHFQPGPIFNNIVLADEINRAPAKVQSALLEAMEERTVTVAGRSHPLPPLFMVLATQNPIEQEGTYPLPEAQLDRFLMKVRIDYPDDEAEAAIIRLLRREEQSIEEPAAGLDVAVVFAARDAVSRLHVAPAIDRYLVDLVMATRQPDRYPDSRLAHWLQIGASSRASLALDRCSRASAWLDGRDYVDPEDVRAVAHPVLRHRLLLSFDADAEGMSSDGVIDELLRQVAAA
jgi:MoxR-like ATPase